MLLVEFQDDKITFDVGTFRDGGYRSVLAPLFGGSVFVAGCTAAMSQSRQGKKESSGVPDAAIACAAAAAGAAIAHYGSFTTRSACKRAKRRRVFGNLSSRILLDS